MTKTKYPMIEDLMFDYINYRVKDNPFYKECLERKDFRSVMVLAAQACVGIVEKTGKNDGDLVNSIQRTVDGIASPNEYWCMDFVMMIRAFSEKVTDIKSPLIWTQQCKRLWDWANSERKDLLVKRVPLPGAIAILKNNKNGYHTKIVIASDNKVASCIDGNTTGYLAPKQNNFSIQMERNGNGVFYTETKLSNPELLGFIKPI